MSACAVAKPGWRAQHAVQLACAANDAFDAHRMADAQQAVARLAATIAAFDADDRRICESMLHRCTPAQSIH